MILDLIATGLLAVVIAYYAGRHSREKQVRDPERHVNVLLAQLQRNTAAMQECARRLDAIKEGLQA